MLIADCHDFFSLCIRTEFHARHIARILSAGLDLPGLSAVVCGSNIVDVIGLFGVISTDCDSKSITIKITANSIPLGALNIFTLLLTFLKV